MSARSRAAPWFGTRRPTRPALNLERPEEPEILDCEFERFRQTLQLTLPSWTIAFTGIA